LVGSIGFEGVNRSGTEEQPARTDATKSSVQIPTPEPVVALARAWVEGNGTGFTYPDGMLWICRSRTTAKLPCALLETRVSDRNHTISRARKSGVATRREMVVAPFRTFTVYMERLRDHAAPLSPMAQEVHSTL
jgi:hypothetical protein